jgi:hypothetical protein
MGHTPFCIFSKFSLLQVISLQKKIFPTDRKTQRISLFSWVLLFVGDYLFGCGLSAWGNGVQNFSFAGIPLKRDALRSTTKF